MDRPHAVPFRAARRLAVLSVSAALVTSCGGGRTAAATSLRAAGIPARLLREARPIGRGPRFHPPARGLLIGPCRSALGHREAVHVEVFAADRVVVIAAGIGVRPPVTLSAGRIVAARCFGSLATVEPTGVVLLRPGTHPSLATLFRSWGQPLTTRRVAGFSAQAPGLRVRVYVAGRRVPGPPGAVLLARHGEVVVEVGPYVPPHTHYTFPPGL